MTKNREKIKKLIFGSELSQNFWIFDNKKWQKMEKKNRKIIFGLEQWASF